MKVHLIKRQTIEGFVSQHSDSRVGFSLWISLIKHADWKIPEDILSTFGSADLLGNGSDRVVFNIGGNKFRMICKYFFGTREIHLFVCWIGNHTEYTKLCKAGQQYTINQY
jgi:mRNA interferase HigB